MGIVSRQHLRLLARSVCLFIALAALAPLQARAASDTAPVYRSSSGLRAAASSSVFTLDNINQPSSNTEGRLVAGGDVTLSTYPAGNNCTYTQGYWKNHPEAWPVQTLTIGGVTYSKAQLLNIFNTPPRGDATYILIHQLIAARLNVAAGADSSAVAVTLAAANAWLIANPLGSKPTGLAAIIGLGYAVTLDSYNNGLIGPGHCGTTPPTPTRTPTSRPTNTPTSRPTNTPTSRPTNTPTSTPTDLPTSTPTDLPTSTPTDLPTNTPTDLPTNTPTSIPTSRPTSTPTSTPDVKLPPDVSICQYEPGWISVEVEVFLPEGQQAILQTNWYIVYPEDLRTQPVYQLHGLVKNGDKLTVQVYWPGIRPTDQIVEIHLSAMLLDPLTMNPIVGRGTGLDYFWYPWVCPAPTPSPTSTPGYL